MNNKKENYIGPVEEKVNSMMEATGGEIIDITQKRAGTREEEIVQKIYTVNLSKCVLYLAKEIDKLASSIK